MIGLPLKDRPLSRVKKMQLSFSRVSLSVLFYALFATSSLAQQANEPAIYEYPGTALKGIVSAEFRRGAGDCRSICEARTGCVGFDFSSPRNICRLFAAVDSAQPDSSSFAGTRHRIPRYNDPANLPPQRPATETEIWHYAQFSGIDFYGGDLEPRGVAIDDVASCARRCENDNACRAFTYNQTQKYCFLKSGYEFVQTIDRGVSGLYFKAKPSMTQIEINVDWELFQMSDLPGNDLTMPPARNYGQCMQACEGNMRCGGFTWVGSVNPGRCYLKQGTQLYPERASKKGMASARKISRDITPDFVRPVAPRD